MDVRNHNYFYELCRPKNYSVCFHRFRFIDGTHLFCMLIPEKSKLLKSALPKITQHNKFEDSFTVSAIPIVY
jgi:hypothetical protein